MIEPGVLLSLGLACSGLVIGAIVWAVRVEGRVNGHDKLFEEREKQLDDRHEDMKERLIRIERKLDANNGTQ